MDLDKALEYMWNKYGITVMVVLFVSLYAANVMNYQKLSYRADLNCPQTADCAVK